MLLSLLLSAALVGLDQLLKALAVQHLAPNGSLTLIPGVVGLRYLENTGAAFSILEGMQTFLIVVTSIALLAVAYVLFFRRPKGKLEYFSLIFILAGGVGNLIDRIAQGYVVDYVNLLFMNFAVFNLADSLVVVGFILLLIGVIKAEVKDKRTLNAMRRASAEADEGAVAEGPGGGAEAGEKPDGDD